MLKVIAVIPEFVLGKYASILLLNFRKDNLYQLPYL